MLLVTTRKKAFFLAQPLCKLAVFKLFVHIIGSHRTCNATKKYLDKPPFICSPITHFRDACQAEASPGEGPLEETQALDRQVAACRAAGVEGQLGPVRVNEMRTCVRASVHVCVCVREKERERERERLCVCVCACV